MIITYIVGEFGEDQLVHQVVETILTATATKAMEEPPSHESDTVATSNSSTSSSSKWHNS